MIHAALSLYKYYRRAINSDFIDNFTKRQAQTRSAIACVLKQICMSLRYVVKIHRAYHFSLAVHASFHRQTYVRHRSLEERGSGGGMLMGEEAREGGIIARCVT